jgi:hypothetical protein
MLTQKKQKTKPSKDETRAGGHYGINSYKFTGSLLESAFFSRSKREAAQLKARAKRRVKGLPFAK